MRRTHDFPIPGKVAVPDFQCLELPVNLRSLHRMNRDSVAFAIPELRARSFAVFSFGKTLHATGWRTGYVVAPPLLSRELRKIHQFNTFSIAAPLQQAIAEYLRQSPQSWMGLSGFFEAKRDSLNASLQGSRLRILKSQGTYFQLIDYSAIDDCGDLEFCDRLIREAKVAVIPLSPFYAEPPRMHLVRLCLAKQDETIREAARRLLQFAGKAG